MSATPRGLSTGQNPSWSLTFWNQVHRYRRLVQKHWWVLVLTLSITLFLGAYYQISRPPTFLSTASMYQDVENRQVGIGSQGSDANPAAVVEGFLDQQNDILKGPMIAHRADEQVRAKYPNEVPSSVRLTASTSNSIILLNATGSDPLYTQRYLQAVLQSYLALRAEGRASFNGESLDTIRNDQIPRVQADIDADDQKIIAFQREHKVVMAKQDSNDEGLTEIKSKLASLRDEYNQLALMTPEQGLDRAAALQRSGGAAGALPSPGNALAASASAEGDFRTAQKELVALKATRDEFAHDLRPEHPKMLDFKRQIDAKQSEIDQLLQYNSRQIKQRMDLVGSEIKEIEAQIAPEKEKALENTLLHAEFDPLLEKKTRDTDTYAALQKTLREATLNMEVNKGGDHMRLLEPASPAVSVPSSWAKVLGMAIVFGLAAGTGILFLIDRMDDRMGSISDFQVHFAESVLGQIPRDLTDVNELLKPDDQRHQLVESFRNLRSTLLFMPLEGARPKTLLITSAVPNEGKSTVSSNLALVMAAAGMKTLLIDADLRRGAIHEAFGVSRDPGLTDVLGHSVNWKIAIRTTGVENLHVLPRGRNVPQPSEYLLNRNTDKLLQELYPLYDYIIIDSSPVLAADDTASLAPKIDATLFVVRMAFTSAKMTRKSLEILYDRQANIPGLIHLGEDDPQVAGDPLRPAGEYPGADSQPRWTRP